MSLGEGAGPGGKVAGVGVASPLVAAPSWGPVWALESDLAKGQTGKAVRLRGKLPHLSLHFLHVRALVCG